MRAFTVEQACAARAFPGWSQRELGEAAGLSYEKIRDFEHDKYSTTARSLTAIRGAFRKSGVEFHHAGQSILLFPRDRILHRWSLDQLRETTCTLLELDAG
jgi:transcriptional regulator with XRE-family HTH domain